MKKLHYTIIISVIGGFVAIFIHNSTYDHSNVNESNSDESKLVNISYNQQPQSRFNQNTDFTIAAEKTINSVVHVKNTSVSKGTSSIWDYFNNKIFKRGKT